MNITEQISTAIFSATLRDLAASVVPEFEYKAIPGGGGKMERVQGGFKKVRPQQHLCKVLSFPQVWGSTALGFGGIGGAAITTAQTTVVFGPEGDAAVYFGGRFAYRVSRPNGKFHQALSEHKLNAVRGALEIYELEPER